MQDEKRDGKERERQRNYQFPAKKRLSWGHFKERENFIPRKGKIIEIYISKSFSRQSTLYRIEGGKQEGKPASQTGQAYQFKEETPSIENNRSSCRRRRPFVSLRRPKTVLSLSHDLIPRYTHTKPAAKLIYLPFAVEASVDACLGEFSKFPPGTVSSVRLLHSALEVD